jgi:outer membrane protein
VNYTIFFDENVDNQLIDLLGSQTGGAVNGAYLDLDNSWGLALQAGVDIPIDEHWAFNVGIAYKF